MKPALLLFLVLLMAPTVHAQTYADSIRAHRSRYKAEFLSDPRSPLKAEDTGFLKFYPADLRYRVQASFEPTPTARSFQMGTHSGTPKKYRQYGVITFTLEGRKLNLQVYQSPDLMRQKELRDYLFIPFNDVTNYLETYGGGRYLDLRLGDIRNNRLILDFNKSYNPYCAYGGSYSCPIPPAANKLPLAIRAGEQLFGKAIKE